MELPNCLGSQPAGELAGDIVAAENRGRVLVGDLLTELTIIKEMDGIMSPDQHRSPQI